MFTNTQCGRECKGGNVPMQVILELQMSSAQVTNVNVQTDNHFKQNFLLIKSLP